MAFHLSSLFSFMGLGRPYTPQISGFVATGEYKDGSPCYAVDDSLDRVTGTAEDSWIVGSSDIIFDRKKKTEHWRP